MLLLLLMHGGTRCRCVDYLLSVQAMMLMLAVVASIAISAA